MSKKEPGDELKEKLEAAAEVKEAPKVAPKKVLSPEERKKIAEWEAAHQRAKEKRDLEFYNIRMKKLAEKKGKKWTPVPMESLKQTKTTNSAKISSATPKVAMAGKASPKVIKQDTFKRMDNKIAKFVEKYGGTYKRMK